MNEGTYRTEEEMITAWGRMAQMKLRADGIDPNDEETAKGVLSQCVGGPRLYEYWKKWREEMRMDSLAFDADYDKRKSKTRRYLESEADRAAKRAEMSREELAEAAARDMEELFG